MSQSIGRKSLDKIKNVLENQKSNIEKQLSRLRREDPFLATDRSRIEEPGTVAMEEDGHRRVETSIKEGERLLGQIKKALSKIGVGKYGICDNCANPIDPKRLEAFPMASLCMACESKKKK